MTSTPSRSSCPRINWGFSVELLLVDGSGKAYGGHGGVPQSVAERSADQPCSAQVVDEVVDMQNI
jgi:hypothetical protein